MTGFFVYVVYIKGHTHYKEELKQDSEREAQYLDDERSVKRAQAAEVPQKKVDEKQQPANGGANPIPAKGPVSKPVDLDEVDLEYDDGNAQRSSPVKPPQQKSAPPAKGGVAGVAF